MAELINELVAGELAMSGQEDSARTGFNAEASALILPGQFVAIATGKEGNLERRGLILPVDANSIIVGACKKWLLREDGHPPLEQVAYYFRGAVGIKVVANVKSGDPVYARFDISANRAHGTNVAGVNAVLVPNARYLSTTASGKVAIVSLNLA